jgi:hypothetical protein
MHKLVCEHLIADYTRKGYVDGRAAGSMTVTGAAGPAERRGLVVLLGIIREPLAGVESICPSAPTSLIR